MPLLLLISPLLFAGICFFSTRTGGRLISAVLGASVHLALLCWTWGPGRAGAGLPLFTFALDPLGHLFLTLISVLFFACTIYFLGYHEARHLVQRGSLSWMLCLLSALSSLCMSQHLGVLWISMEAASLAATPLIYSHLNARALRATWKFLLMNSLGIALALLGVFCIAISTLAAKPVIELSLLDLVERAQDLDPVWLRAGFLFAMIGFGTKMGLAPLHTWKPEAYGESPPHIAAFLAGGVTLGAFIGILRVYAICVAAGLQGFAGAWLIAFGLFSIATAGVCIVNNPDYRRILAYTSVEHMGVLAVGMGLGMDGGYASMLHALHNTLNKGVLFLVAGFLWRMYRSNRICDVRGTIHQYPMAGLLLVGGLCATCALPPFGMFFSELGILFAAAAHAQWWTLALFAVSMCFVFAGVITATLPMVFGPPTEAAPANPRKRERWREAAMLAPAALLLLAALFLGVAQPAGVRDALDAAAQQSFPSIHQETPSKLASTLGNGDR